MLLQKYRSTVLIRWGWACVPADINVAKLDEINLLVDVLLGLIMLPLFQVCSIRPVNEVLCMPLCQPQTLMWPLPRMIITCMPSYAR